MKTVNLLTAISNADVIESIRNGVEIVTSSKKGLASPEMLKAINYKKVALANGDSATLGKVMGLCIITHNWSLSTPAVLLIDNHSKTITQISGRDYTTMPLELTWTIGAESSDNTLKLKSKYSNTSYKTDFIISFQSLY